MKQKKPHSWTYDESRYDGAAVVGYYTLGTMMLLVCGVSILITYLAMMHDFNPIIQENQELKLLLNLTAGINYNDIEIPISYTYFENECRRIGGKPNWHLNSWKQCYKFRYDRNDMLSLQRLCGKKKINVYNDYIDCWIPEE